MQQNRLEGWIVKQIENTNLSKEIVIQLPKRPNTSPLPTRTTRSSAITRRSVAAVAGQEICSLLPTPSPRQLPECLVGNNRNASYKKHNADERVERSWRSQFKDVREPCIEAGHIDRTKVLHNMNEKQRDRDDKQSPLFLCRGRIPGSIRKSVLPSSWAHPFPRYANERQDMPDAENDVAHVHRIVSKTLAPVSPSTLMKPSSSRTPSPSQSPIKSNSVIASGYRGGRESLRNSTTFDDSKGPTPPRLAQRAEERIEQFIAELRADPNLWAAFQRDAEHIQHQHRLRNHASDKIRKNMESARTPRSKDALEQRKKRNEERMGRTRQQRDQLVQLEHERLAAKREAYLRRVNPTQELPPVAHKVTVRYRRLKLWRHAVAFAAVSNCWQQQFVETKTTMAMAKSETIAASIIQHIWRKWKWQHESKQAAVVYKWLRKFTWKFLLRLRCRHKAQHALLLRQFMLDHFTESHAKKNLNRMAILWRSKVIHAQRAGMSFVYCTRARMQALSMWWESVDHERQRLDRQQYHVSDGRRSTQRRDSIIGILGSSASRPGSASIHRKGSSMTGAIVPMAGVDEKFASMQMLLTPIEIQRKQQHAIQIVKIPKSIKTRLLTELLANARSDFRRKQQEYKQLLLCAGYAREVKLEEARAIVQSSMNRDGATPIVNSAKAPPPCFVLFSDPKTMETLVRRGVELTLEADPELEALITRQQEQRLQSSRRS